MLPSLKAMGVCVACYGNHDFDFGERHLMDLARRCPFPWLMSNALKRNTGRPLADG